MASNSMLETFDPAVESVDNYKECIDFHCTATGVKQDRQKGTVFVSYWTIGIHESQNFGKSKVLSRLEPPTNHGINAGAL